MNDGCIFMVKNPYHKLKEQPPVKQYKKSEDQYKQVKQHQRRDCSKRFSDHAAARRHDLVLCVIYDRCMPGCGDAKSVLRPCRNIINRSAYLALEHGPVAGKFGDLRTHQVRYRVYKSDQ